MDSIIIIEDEEIITLCKYTVHSLNLTSFKFFLIKLDNDMLEVSIIRHFQWHIKYIYAKRSKVRKKFG